MALQKFLTPANDYAQLDEYLSTLNARKIMLVHGKSMTRLAIGAHFDQIFERFNIIRFNDFEPNPQYESILRGVEVFNREGCDAIIGVGGGSAIDTAKCIKLFSTMPPDVDRLKQPVFANAVELLAIPTTAGSGSEATPYAIFYRGDTRLATGDADAVPRAVLFDAGTLINLPDYQKKVTLLDALCHSIESFWSVRANELSMNYAREAIRLLVSNKDQYVGGSTDLQNCTFIMYAANLAGRAISITGTTAGHAMSYRLTKKFGLAHGHAVARCLVEIWKFMLEIAIAHKHVQLLNVFNELAEAMGCRTPADAIEMLRRTLSDWKLDAPLEVEPLMDELVSSVSKKQVANGPVSFNDDILRRLYRAIGG